MHVYTINGDLLEDDTAFSIPADVQKAINAVTGNEGTLAGNGMLRDRDCLFPITAEVHAREEEARRQEEERQARLPKIGDKAADGWIYGGISSETGDPMYASPEDWTGFDWYWAMDMAEVLKRERHRDVRLPTETELMQLFENKEVIGNFCKTGSDYAAWYFTSTPAPMTHYDVLCQNFKTGEKNKIGKSICASIRFVAS